MLLSENQFCFRFNLSTTDAFTAVRYFLILNIDRGKQYRYIFLDLSKTFDTITHNILIHKWSANGMREKTRELL